MNDWDGVIAVEENPTTDNRRIVAGALQFENELPVMTAASLRADSDTDRLRGKTQLVWREGKLIWAEGQVDAPPGSYSASIAVGGTERTLFRGKTDTDRGTYTIMSGAILEVVLMPVNLAVWPEASITVYDGRNPSTHDEMIRRMLDITDTRLESGALKKHYRDDPTVLQCEHGTRLHVGWLEIHQDSMRAQALLDQYQIPDGDPQGKGDLDWRTAEAMSELSDARSFLAAIASAHEQERGNGGMVGSYCIECGRVYPCPTRLWALGEHQASDAWEGDE